MSNYTKNDWQDAAEELTKHDNRWLRKIWIKKLNINLKLIKDKGYVLHWDKTVGEVTTQLKINEHDYFIQCILRGHAEIQKEVLGNGKAEDTKEWRQARAICEKLKEVEERNITNKSLATIKLAMGEEAFSEWSSENGFDTEDIYEQLEAYFAKSDWPEKVKAWLEATLANGPIAIIDIRDKAVQDGLLMDDLQDWPAFEKHAQRLGYTKMGKRGYWG